MSLYVTADPKCNADFGFVIDVSGSVENYWDDQKRFVKKLVEKTGFNISPNGGHAAVTLFSSNAKLMIKFSEDETLSSFETALNALPFWNGITKINLGLEVALDNMFQATNGMRKGVTRNLILISDGQQAGLDFDAWRQKLSKAGIRVIAIGVGNVRERDLKLLVNDDKDLYMAKDFNMLLSDSFINGITLCGGNMRIQIRSI